MSTKRQPKVHSPRPAVRPGGRAERVVHDVLRAALSELGRVGWARLRVEDVAERAGVNKTTVYRRWPTKEELLVAALEAFAGGGEIPDAGSLRADLTELAHALVARGSSAGGLGIARISAAEIDDPKVRGHLADLRARLRAPWIAVIERAVERGELPRGTDVELVAHAVISPITSRLFRMREKVSPEQVAAIIELVLHGAEHGGAVIKAKRSLPRRDSSAPRSTAGSRAGA